MKNCITTVQMFVAKGWKPVLLTVALFALAAAWQVQAEDYTFTTLAGYSGLGSADGTGIAARFYYPSSVAVDHARNIYVADFYNNTIRMVTPAGVVSTFAGQAGVAGYADGAGGVALFNGPSGVAIDAAGVLYVADKGNSTIRKITAAGVVSTVAGQPGVTGSTDGSASVALFNNPRGVAVDAAGDVYVADTANDTIRKIAPGGNVTTLAGQAGTAGSADGPAAAAQFNNPFAVALDAAGNLFVADCYNYTIRKITPAGHVSTLAGLAETQGSADGKGSEARFYNPAGLAVGSSGTVYVADKANSTIRRITAAGKVTTLAGKAGTIGGADGKGTDARFNNPSGLALDSSGTLYVADRGNSTIRKISPHEVVSTLAGIPGGSGSADGVGIAARFYLPNGAVADAAGNVYVADEGNNTIRKITAAGKVSTLAGLAWAPGSADGWGHHARFDHPEGLAVDAAGNVYVADEANDTIRKITPAGVVSTLAGSPGAIGSDDGQGSAARFYFPASVAVDTLGYVYVADSGNNTIRKITPDGTVSTLAGAAGVWGSANGTGSAAQFGGPYGVAVDAVGNVYVADQGNNTIRKITAGGVVTTLAGTAGVWGIQDGTGPAAQFEAPAGVAVDSAGNVYTIDFYGHTVRKITAGGVVTTIGGLAGVHGTTDGVGTAARFSFPGGIGVDSAGNLYVADYENHVIRKGLPGALPPIAEAGTPVFIPQGPLMSPFEPLCAQPTPGLGGNWTPGVIPPQARPFGRSYGEWANLWWQWAYRLPITGHPLFDLQGINAAAGQSGPVWFLAGTWSGSSGSPIRVINRTITVPTGKALFFPLLNSATWVCDFARTAPDSYRNMSCTIDGRSVKGLSDPLTTPYRLLTPSFGAWLPEEDNYYQSFGLDWVGTATNPWFGNGVYLMLAPLSVGQHTVRFTGNIVDSTETVIFGLDITYMITVTPSCGEGDEWGDRDDGEGRDGGRDHDGH